MAQCSKETSSSVAISLHPAVGPLYNYSVEADCSTVTNTDGNCPQTSTGVETTHVFSSLNSDTTYTFVVTATANNRRSARLSLTCRTLKGQY